MATVQAGVLCQACRAATRHRQMQRMPTLGLIFWNLLMIGWAATYLGGAGDCALEAGSSLTVCGAGRSIGIEVGLHIILRVWIVGSAALAVIWLRRRPA